MGEFEDILSEEFGATDMFGEATLLAVGQEVSDGASQLFGGGGFRLVSLLVAVAYLALVVRYWRTIWSVILFTIGGKTAKRGKSEQVLLMNQKNIETAMSAIGIFAIAAVGVRLCGGALSGEGAGVSQGGEWLIFGLMLCALAALVATESLLLWGVGFVTEERPLCKGIAEMKLLHLSAAAAFIAPTALILLFAPQSCVGVWLWIVAAQCAVSVILFIKETFLFFLAQRVSILHWILYLCTLELFPVSLLLAPIVR